VRLIQYSFNAGEWSELLESRIDLQKYGSACRRLRNAFPTVQGPARRRSGFRYLSDTKDSADRSWLYKFEFSEDQAFELEFGDGYVRFYREEALLRTGAVTAWSNLTAYVPGNLASRLGVNYYCILGHTNQVPPNATYWYPLTSDIFEVPMPYAIADLTMSDGTFALSFHQVGDVVYIAHAGGTYAPRKLTRLGLVDWTITTGFDENGPYIGIDPDETITVYAGAATGSTTLTASAGIFSAEHVGTEFYLEAKLVDGVTQWEQAKVIGAGVERRSGDNVYLSLNAATTGNVKPTHTEGARYDGDTGVQWQYLHSGYGIVRIDSLTSALIANVTVLSRIPSQAVGAGNASTRWSFSEFDSVRGYPEHVAFYRERKCYARANAIWASVSGDYDNFAAREGGLVLADSAISIVVAADNNGIQWMTDADDLMVGTTGAEFAVGRITTAEVLAPDNVDAPRQTNEGGRNVEPAKIGGSIVFVQNTGQEVREFDFTLANDRYTSIDLTPLAEHIAAGKIIQMAYQKEPHSVLWCCCENGDLIALTHDKEQDVIGWHKHPVGGNGLVESVVCTPRSDGIADKLTIQVKRTINGSTVRTIEYLERDFEPTKRGDTLLDAYFVDSFGVISGESTDASTMTVSLGTAANWDAPTEDEYTLTASTSKFVAGDVGDQVEIRVGTDRVRLTILTYTSGTVVSVRADEQVPAALRAVATADWAFARSEFTINRLEASTLQVCADGEDVGTTTVTAGVFQIDSPAIQVVYGLGYTTIIQAMRLEVGSRAGTDFGRIKRVNDILVSLMDTVGGKFGPNEDDLHELELDNEPSAYDQPPQLFSGDVLQDYNEGYATNAAPMIVQDAPLPLTLRSMSYDVEMEDP